MGGRGKSGRGAATTGRRGGGGLRAAIGAAGRNLAARVRWARNYPPIRVDVHNRRVIRYGGSAHYSPRSQRIYELRGGRIRITDRVHLGGPYRRNPQGWPDY